MTQEEFESEAICCCECGETPKIHHIIEEVLFSGEQAKDFYICKCDADSWLGMKTGHCKTAENALRAWNRKMIARSSEY